MDWSGDTAAGDWIAARLGPFGSGPAGVVPGGFAAYARVLHPAGGYGDDPGTPWATVAAWAGTALGPTSAWLEVALPEHRPDAPRPWPGTGPDEGAYPAAVSRGLVEVLAAHTADPDDVWSATWEGWGELAPPPGVSRLALPHRAYLLRHGDLAGTARLPADAPWAARPPSLWWPADRAWCVATEIDDDRTYVGGPPALVDALRDHPHLEAQRIDRTAPAATLPAPGWLQERLAAARVELLGTGATSLVLSRGRVDATYRAPRRLRPGGLDITTVDDHGGRGGSSMPLRAEQDAPHQVASALLWSVAALVR